MSRAKRIEVRVSEYERHLWAEAAGGAGLVSEWLRSIANIEASKSDTVGFGKPAKTHKNLTSCARFQHHRPGTYCSTCGRVN